MADVNSPDGLTLTVVDMVGIQGYVFGSNRLRDNVVASAQVEQATRLWPFVLIDKDMAQDRRARGLPLRHNLQPLSQFGYDFRDDRHIERDELEVEALYGAGGNTVLLFATHELAHDFAYRYSRKLLCDAPGLEAALVHLPIAWDTKATDELNLRRALPAAFAQLEIKKGNRPLSRPLLGLGVTVQCEVTGLPAVGYDRFYAKMVAKEEQALRPVSAILAARGGQENVDWARSRLRALMPRVTQAGFDFWYDPDASDVRSTEPSEGGYMAVVHADGNGIGARFSAITRRARDDRHAIDSLRTLSRLVDRSSERALAALDALLVSDEVWDRREHQLAQRVQLGRAKNREGREVMPFRPLIFGGDDLTYICEGRLGIALAAAYLQAFEKEVNAAQARHPDLLELLPARLHKWHACAGVAIVKTHYPFARAYELSESLCRQAKNMVVAESQAEDAPESQSGGFSALDWHITAGGLYGYIEQIREHAYTVPLPGNPVGNLAARPLRLHEDARATWRTWPVLRRVVEELRNGKDWKGKQNKVMQLREALRGGPVAVQRYRASYRLAALPMIDATLPDLQTGGWDGDRCGYFDAIEAMDFLVTLPPTGAPEASTDEATTQGGTQ